MIGNKHICKIMLLSTISFFAAAFVVFPRNTARGWSGLHSVLQQATHQFIGQTHISPLEELATAQYDSSLAVDSAGNAYAVWTDNRNGNEDIYFAYRPAGGNWDPNVQVNDDVTSYNQTSPSIAVDSSENAYAVWTDRRNGNEDIFFAFRPAGGDWGANVRINDDGGSSYQALADIAVTSGGDAYAVWRDGRDGFRDIYFAYRPSGGGWGANVKVNDDLGSSDKDHPAIAVDNIGNAYAIWDDDRNGNQDIYSAYRPESGDWGTNVLVNDDLDPDFDQEYPDIAVDATGNAYAVWNDERDYGYSLFFSYRTVSGSWQANVPVYTDWYVEGAPSITVDGSGNAYAAWGEVWDWNASGLAAAHRPSGGSWGDPVYIGSYDATFKGDPSLAMSTDGDVFVVWTDNRNDDVNIYFAHHPSGGSWGGVVRVNDDSGGSPQFNPSLAVSQDGTAYAIWEDTYNSEYVGDIHFSSRPAGGPWDASVQVNDGLGSAFNAAIAVDGNGNAYAVWGDYRNGDWDIYFAYRPVGGDWGTNVRVNDDLGTGQQFRPAIVVDHSGNAYAVWDDDRNSSGEDETVKDIYFAYRPAGGDWGANVKVDPEHSSGWQTRPSIAVDSVGNTYAVWDGEDPDGVFFAYRPVGGSWGADVKVDIGIGGSNRMPDIAVDPDGNAYAIWIGEADFLPDIYFAYRPAGGAWGASETVNDVTDVVDWSPPAIAVDADGNAYAVWEDDRNNGPDIYFSYRPAGGSWEENILVNQSPGESYRTLPDVGVDGHGKIYVVWEDWQIATAAIYFAHSAGERVFLPVMVR